jgi:hypothetical protein
MIYVALPFVEATGAADGTGDWDDRDYPTNTRSTVELPWQSMSGVRADVDRRSIEDEDREFAIATRARRATQLRREG